MLLKVVCSDSNLAIALLRASGDCSPTSWSAATIPVAAKHGKDALSATPNSSRAPSPEAKALAETVLVFRMVFKVWCRVYVVSQYSVAAHTISSWLMPFKSWHHSFASFAPLRPWVQFSLSSMLLSMGTGFQPCRDQLVTSLAR